MDSLPALVEIRVGADVPPEYKNVSRKHKRDVRTPTLEMCRLLQCCRVLTHLRNLVLKDITNTELEAVLASCGRRLERLEVHYMSSGVDLSVINKLCSGLVSLNICNSRLFLTSHTKMFLPKLEQCRLMRVCYEEETEHIFLSRCGSVRTLHQEAGPGLTDQLVCSLVTGGSLQALGQSLSCSSSLSSLFHSEQLVINGDCLLTSQSVLSLMELPHLTKLGDIQDWSITEEARRQLFSLTESKWKRRMGQTRNIIIDD